MTKLIVLSLLFCSSTFANTYTIGEVSITIKDKKMKLDPVPSDYLSIIHVIEKAAGKAAKSNLWDDAVTLANKARELAKKNKYKNIKNPNINCSLHTSNIILGADALNKGQLKIAGDFLMASLDEKKPSLVSTHCKN